MKKAVLFLMFSVAIYIGCFWQLEMVWVGYATGWGYRFGWLPNNFPSAKIWFWRDLFWVFQVFAYIIGLYGAYRVGKRKI